MRALILAAFASVLFGASAATALTVDHPGICPAYDRAWRQVAGGNDLAAMDRLIATIPAEACPNLRAEARRVRAERARTPQTPVTTTPPVSTTPPPTRARREFDDCSGAGWCPRMIVVPTGSFTMGSPESEPDHTPDEGPRHRVRIRQFAAGKLEITFDQWAACAQGGGCANNPSPSDQGWGRRDRPVINVSWNDAQEYAHWLSVRTGHHYRLLTEAEWEYAARAGTTTRYWTGDSVDHNQAQFGGTRTRAAGSYRPNAFGLFDTIGNVAEWVDGCPTRTYDGTPTDGSAQQGSCAGRVHRGGGFGGDALNVRAANRSSAPPDSRSENRGFRIARDMD
jgi:formylglycine-generating enzyme required for sulfatase activity